MPEEGDKRNAYEGDRPVHPTVLVLGIALFVTGFLITVTSMSGSLDGQSELASGDLRSSEAQTSSTSGLLMFIGIVLSMSGVVSATAGPAAYFVHSRRRSG
jgi:hypothetical protein